MRTTIVFLLGFLFLIVSNKSYSQSTQGCDCAYPIIFVHGAAGSYKDWNYVYNDNSVQNIFGNFDDEFIRSGIPLDPNTPGSPIIAGNFYDPADNSHIYNAVLNATESFTIPTDVLLHDNFNNSSEIISNSCMYAVNFDNQWGNVNGIPYLGNSSYINSSGSGSPLNNVFPNPNSINLGFNESDSNESSLFKQAYALSDAIRVVLQKTQKDKVILVGNSTGGLAIREYLQRDENGRKWWVDPSDIQEGHKVAKVLTISSPHLGTNVGSKTIYNTSDPQFIGDMMRLDGYSLYSEAARDTRKYYFDCNNNQQQGVYLFGGSENLIQQNSVCSRDFHNVDVNCNGLNNSTISSLNSGTSYNTINSLPKNIKYNYQVSDIELLEFKQLPQLPELVAFFLVPTGLTVFTEIYNDFSDAVNLVSTIGGVVPQNSNGLIQANSQWLYTGGDGSTNSFNLGNSVSSPFMLSPNFLSDRITSNNLVPSEIFNLLYKATDVNGNSIDTKFETNDLLNLIRGLDEPDYPYFAYEIEKYKQYSGVIQIRADKVPDNSFVLPSTYNGPTTIPKNQVDSDWFYMDLSEMDKTCKLAVQFDPGGDVNTPFQLEFFDGQSPLDQTFYNTNSQTPLITPISGINGGSNSILDEFDGSLVTSGQLYIRVTHYVDDPEEWKFPYKLRISPYECEEENCLSSTPQISFINQNDVVMDLAENETITFYEECGLLNITTGCLNASWYIVDGNGNESFQNTGLIFQPISDLDPTSTGSFTYAIKVYNEQSSNINSTTPSSTFNIAVIDGGSCPQCDHVFDILLSSMSNSNSSEFRVMDCQSLPPCSDCGSDDIVNYCVSPLVKDTIISLCDPIPTFEALDDCYQWYETVLGSGSFFPDYSNNIDGKFFTPNNITQAGTYYYHLVDIRKSAIEGCGIYLQITAEECPPDPIVITSPNGSENFVASNTYDIKWEINDVYDDVRIGYSNDGGSSWTWPEDIGLPFLTDNDGCYEWTIPCHISNGGGFVNTTNAIIGIFPPGGYPTQPLDVSDNVFSIGACLDNRVDLAVVATHPDPCIQLNPGDQDYVQVELTNVGTIPTTVDWSWGLFLGDDTNFHQSDLRLCQEDVQVVLAPGETLFRNCTFTIPINTAIGTYYLEIIADDGNNFIGSYQEPNEENNEYFIEVKVGDISTLKPDLTIPNLTIDANGQVITCGSTIDISVDVQNVGLSDYSDPVSMDFYLSTDNVLDPSDTNFNTLTVGSISPNNASSYNSTLPLPSPTNAGTYWIIAHIDSDEDLDELSENNNQFTQSFIIEKRPDYIVQSTTIPNPQNDYCGGDQFLIDYTLGNIGTAGFGVNADVTFYLSQNTSFDVGDVQLFHDNFTLDGNGTFLDFTNQNVILPNHLGTGTYYILGVVDSGELVSELNENNNTYALPIEVKGLEVSCTRVPPSCGENNGSIELSVENGKALISYQWSNGETTNSIENIGEGNYSVTVTDGGGNASIKNISLFESSGVPAVLSAYNIGANFYNSVSTDGTSIIYSSFFAGDMAVVNGQTFSNNFGTFLASYNNDDQLNWLIDYATIDQDLRVIDSYIDQSGNIYVHFSYTSGSSNIDFGNGVIHSIGTSLANNDFILKYNSNGQALALLTTSLPPTIEGFTLCEDSGNYWLITDLEPAEGFLIRKFDSSGNILLSKLIDVQNGTPISTAGTYSYIQNAECYGDDFTFSLGIGVGDVFYDGQLITRAPAIGSSRTNFVFNINGNDGSLEYVYSDNFVGGTSNVTSDGFSNSFFSNSTGIYQLDLSNQATLISSDPTGFIASDGEFLFYSAAGNKLVKYDPSSDEIVWTYDLPFGLLNNTGIEVDAHDGKFYIFYNYNNEITIEGEVFEEESTEQGIALIIGDEPIENFGINLPSDTTFCKGSILTLDIADNRFPNLNYVWSSGNTGPEIVITDAGLYTVTTTDNSTGCNSETSINVEEICPSASLNTTDISCSGESAVLSLSNATDVITYAWSTGESTPSIQVNNADIYMVTLTDAKGCTQTLSEEIVVADAEITPNIMVVHTTCSQPNGEITVTDQNGTYYPEIIWDNGHNLPSRSLLWGGNYSFTVTDSEGCTAEFTTTVNNSLGGFGINTISIIPSSCDNNDGGFRLDPVSSFPSVPSDFSYEWFDGSTDFEITGMSSGFYPYTVTHNPTGCKVSGIAEIFDHKPQNVDYMYTPSFCNGGSITLGNQFDHPDVEIEWSNGETNPTINNLAPGLYFVTINDQNNCVLEERIEITGNQLLEAKIETTSNLCQAQTPVEVLVEGGVSPYIYAWSNGDDMAITQLPVGQHNVTITDQVGCSIEKEHIVENQSNAGLISFEPDKTICDGESAAIQLFIEGVVGPFEITLNDGQDDITICNYNLLDEIDLMPNETTTYGIVEITDGLGCVASSNDEITITVNSKIQIVANLLDVQTCQGTSAKVEPIIIGGTAPYSITYNNGSTIFTEDNFINGDQIELLTTNSTVYYFTDITDANGCSFSFIDEVAIIETPCTISNNFLPSDPCACNDDQSANGAQDGTFSETISVSTTSNGQTWTVVSIASLQSSGTLPQGISVGDQLIFDAINNRHTYTFNHTDQSGYAISVEGPNDFGNLNNVVLDFQNVCSYPTLLNNVLDEEINLCETSSLDLTSLNYEIESNPGQLTIYINSQVSSIFDIETLGEGSYTIDFEFDGDFVNNANGTINNPAFPGCTTSTREIVEVVKNTKSIVCNDNIQISLAHSCELNITPDMLLEAGDDISYTIVLGNGQSAIAQGLNEPFVGLDLSLSNFQDTLIPYTISTFCGISCWGEIQLENKLIPEFDCADAYILCTDDADPGQAVPFPLFEDSSTWEIDDGSSYTVTFDDLECHYLTATYVDSEITGCGVINGDGYSKIIRRNWIITSNSGLTQECLQSIYLLRSTLADVVFPPNYDGVSNTAFSCNDIGSGLIDLDPSGYPAPSSSGRPEFLYGELCSNYFIDYEDVELPLCGVSYKLIRKWSVLDWCIGEVLEHNQIIKVEDNLPVVKSCPVDTLVFHSDPYRCAANIILDPEGLYDDIPGDILFSYDCSDYELFVEYLTAIPDTDQPVNGPFTRVTQNNNGTYTIPDIEVGIAWIRYVFVDACGNTFQNDGGNQTNTFDDCRFEVMVVDKTPPNPVCIEYTVATLGPDGCARVEVTSFDNGSYDNCGVQDFRARVAGSGDNFTSMLEFCCPQYSCGVSEDIELIVFDGSLSDDIILADYSNVGECINYNNCFVKITFQDDIDPMITSGPANPTTLACDMVINTQAELMALFDLTAFVVVDNCVEGLPTPFLPSNTFPITPNGACGGGSFSFTWVVEDGCGNEDTYDSEITFGVATPLNLNSVQFPYNATPIEIIGCAEYDESNPLTPENLFDLHDFGGVVTPQPGNVDCSTTAIRYEDLYFYDVQDEGVCTKIVRTWTVVDWCTYNSDTGEGQIQQTQIIKLIDATNPILQTSYSVNCETDILYNQQADECRPFVKIILDATDDCASADDLLWDVTVRDCNGLAPDVTFDTYVISGHYYHGEIEVTATVTDFCGNQVSSTFTIDILDCKPPTPYCISDITTVTLPDPLGFEIWATDFDLGSYDDFADVYNCSTCAAAGTLPLEFYLLDPDTGDLEPVLNFDCTDIPNGEEVTMQLQMWVVDPNGAPGYDRDYCTVTLIVQDNENDACTGVSGSGFSRIAGNIHMIDNRSVDAVLVTLQSNQPEFPKTYTTTPDGDFAFNSLPESTQYSISSAKNNDVLNGVSTLDILLIQRHLLNLTNFTSPYQYIAADANNTQSVSASDMVAIRNVILEKTSEYVNGQQSWRFVDGAHTFPVPSNPFPFDENITANLNSDMLDKDFIAVKIGDINNSAIAQATGSNEAEFRGAPLTMSIASNNYQAGETVSIAVTSENFEAILGMQYTLSYDASLEYKRIEAGVLDITNENLGLNHLSNNQLTLSWNTVEAITAGSDDVLFTIVFDALGAGSTGTALTLDNTITRVEAYDNDLNVLNVQLGSNGDIAEGLTLYQNVPNPFTGETTIGFSLQKEQFVQLSVFDMNGKVVKQFHGDYAKGYNSVILDANELQIAGVFYYQMSTNEFSQTRKMIIAN